MEDMILIEDISKTFLELQDRLRLATLTFERSDEIKNIRKEICKNQERCPHIIKHNFEYEVCPYCGKSL